MDDYQSANVSDDENRAVSADQLDRILTERLDVEALAQMVEHLDFAGQLSEKLTKSFADVRAEIGRQAQVLGAAQQELRLLIQDVALAKRALASLGQTGVAQRQRIERELIRELFPPAEPRLGAGVAVNGTPQAPRSVDCASRLHVCKAVCCRLLNVPLTPGEVDRGIYEWDTRQPYILRRQGEGCVHLAAGTCACALYAVRPSACQTYDCSRDARIWSDFEKMELNAEMAKRLEPLRVDTGPAYARQSATPPVSSLPAEGVASNRAADGAKQLADRDSAPEGDASSARSVAPPNFEELRAMIVPKPAKLFAPPKRESGDNGVAEPQT